MSKKILSLMLVVAMLFTYTFVYADAVSTITIEDFDASKIADNTMFKVPVVLNNLPADVIAGFQMDISFDSSLLRMQAPSTNYYALDMQFEDEDTGDIVPTLSTTTKVAFTAANALTGTTAGTGVISGRIQFADSAARYMMDKSGLAAASNTMLELRFRKWEGITAGDVSSTTVTVSNIKFVTADGTAYTVDNGAIAAPSSFEIQLKEAAPAVSVAWTTDTEVITGAMRFLFDAVVTGGEVVASGVKFLKSNDFDAEITSIDKEGAVTTFSADVNEIPEDAAGTYYAAGYVKIGDDYKWEIVGCTLN